MIKEVILLIGLLGANTHKQREKAQIALESHDVCFECLLEHYPTKDPEKDARLKEILWIKYMNENQHMYKKNVYVYNPWNSEAVQMTDFKLLRGAFRYELSLKE